MGNRHANVKQVEITRSVKGVVAAGIDVGRVDIDHATGKVIVYAKGAGEEGQPNEWDVVLRNEA